MRKLHVICPICSKARRIAIPPEIFNNEEGALLKLIIPQGKVCDHEFLVLMDYNFSIRDYETTISSERRIYYENKNREQRIRSDFWF